MMDALSDDVEVSEAGTDDACVVALRESSPDVVLVFDQSAGLDLLARVVSLIGRHSPAPIPVVVAGGPERDEARTFEAFRRGAEEYVVAAPDSEGLETTLRAAVERHRCRAQLAAGATEDGAESRFLSHVSHELRSPLAAIYQFLTLVYDGVAGPTNPEQREYLSTALRSLVRLEETIDALIDGTRSDEDDRGSRRAA
jgi:signal transduction histidine kinase